jgi:peptidylprolyl isomerase
MGDAQVSASQQAPPPSNSTTTRAGSPGWTKNLYGEPSEHGALLRGGLVSRSLWTLALAALLAGLAGCGGESAPTGPTELVIEDLALGTGAPAATGETVTVHYVGAFLDGRVFDSSVSRGEPYSFRLGAGAVIPGFEQGVTGMRVGGRRRVIIPPHLAYGSRGQGSIPPNTPIQFEIQLLAVAGR